LGLADRTPGAVAERKHDRGRLGGVAFELVARLVRLAIWIDVRSVLHGALDAAPPPSVGAQTTPASSSSRGGLQTATPERSRRPSAPAHRFRHFSQCWLHGATSRGYRRPWCESCLPRPAGWWSVPRRSGCGPRTTSSRSTASR